MSTTSKVFLAVEHVAANAVTNLFGSLSSALATITTVFSQCAPSPASSEASAASSAPIQRSAISTPPSTFALSRGRRGRAGSTAVP